MVPRSDGANLETLLGGIDDAFKDNNFRRYSLGSIISWLSFFVRPRPFLQAVVTHRGIAAIIVGRCTGCLCAANGSCFRPKNGKQGVEGYSILLARAGIGAMLSALWLAHGGVRRSSPAVIMWAFLGFLIALVGVLQTESLAEAAFAMIALGRCFEICRTGAVALLQTSVLDELRGRVMTTQFLLMRLAGALGVYAIGAIADDRGLRTSMLRRDLRVSRMVRNLSAAGSRHFSVRGARSRPLTRRRDREISPKQADRPV
jgi:hypothetical protein